MKKVKSMSYQKFLECIYLNISIFWYFRFQVLRARSCPGRERGLDVMARWLFVWLSSIWASVVWLLFWGLVAASPLLGAPRPVIVSQSLISCQPSLTQEIYKGEIKADKDKTKPWLVQYLITLLSRLMQFQIQRDDKSHRGCSVALHNSWLIYFALSFIYLLGSDSPGTKN